MKRFSDLSLELSLSRILKWGVIISSILVISGGIIYLLKEAFVPINYHIFVGEPKILNNPFDIKMIALTGDPAAIIQLGIVALIATPLAKVLYSAYSFALRKNWIYLTICSLTSLLLILSLGGFFT